jgi:hypothetical protein
MAGKRWAPKNHGAQKKTFLRKDVSMGMGNGQGECGLEKMMGLRRRCAREKMCPWGEENRAKERMWPEGKDRPKDGAQEGNEAGEKMGPWGTILS